MRGTTRRAALAAGLALLVASGACAGDDGDTTGTASSTTTGASSASPSSTTTTTTTIARSAGCGAGTDVAPGQARVEMGDRFYLRHVPAAADGETPLPVVVDLHGYAEGAEVHVAHSQLGPFGDEQGFVTVSPHGTGEVPSWRATPGSPDVAFVAAVLDDVEDDLCIDRDRIHVTGLSNGAMMTSALICDLSDRIASAAAVAGVAFVEGCDQERPVPLLAFHGTEDTFLAFGGGLGESVGDLPTPDGSGETLGDRGVRTGGGGPSVPEVMAAWASRYGCDDEPAEEQVADDVALLRFECPEPVAVELYRIDGGGHTWPGSAFSASIEGIVGPTTMSISANEVMWDFFQEHRLSR